MRMKAYHSLNFLMYVSLPPLEKKTFKKIRTTKQIQLRKTHKHSDILFFLMRLDFFGIRLMRFIIHIEVMSLISSPGHLFE